MLTYLDQDVNIRIDLEASRHATDRFFRHGFEEKIEEGDIIDIVERSIEELTIAMMQNKVFNIIRMVLFFKFSIISINPKNFLIFILNP